MIGSSARGKAWHLHRSGFTVWRGLTGEKIEYMKKTIRVLTVSAG
ncbi:hypothetical protein [Nitrosomonas aestuarii]|nr:hypothetical protein [Nitrosomonas aestuarii]PTN11827.1 hypothetical protein C8R11_107112 [Nitrosomonas aestuarii]